MNLYGWLMGCDFELRVNTEGQEGVTRRNGVALPKNPWNKFLEIEFTLNYNNITKKNVFPSEHWHFRIIDILVAIQNSAHSNCLKIHSIGNSLVTGTYCEYSRLFPAVFNVSKERGQP